MMKNNVKSKVLSEIMDLMDQKEGEKLMSHPKLMAMKVVKAGPVDKEIVGSPEDMKKDIMEGESKDLEDSEMKSGMDLDELDKESLDPVMLEKLMKLLK
jgi:hypothetical protein